MVDHLKGIDSPNLEHGLIKKFTAIDGHKFRLPKPEHIELSTFQSSMMNVIQKNRKEEVEQLKESGQIEETEEYLGPKPIDADASTVGVSALFIIAALAGAGYLGYNMLQQGDKKPTRKSKKN